MSDVRQVIEDNYYRPVNPQKLDEASINGMLDDFKKRVTKAGRTVDCFLYARFRE